MILFRLYSFPLEVESSGIGNTGPVFTWYQNKICSIRFCISLQIKHINCRAQATNINHGEAYTYKRNDRGSFSIPGCQQKLLCAHLCHCEVLRGRFGGVLTCIKDLSEVAQFSGAAASLFVCVRATSTCLRLNTWIRDCVTGQWINSHNMM